MTMANTWKQVFDGTAVIYTDPQGNHFTFGDLWRQTWGESYPVPNKPGWDVIRRSPRGFRPTQQGRGSEKQTPQRQCFAACTDLWRNMPDLCPPCAPCKGISAKKNVWDSKQAGGVKSSYYDHYMGCCMANCKIEVKYDKIIKRAQLKDDINKLYREAKDNVSRIKAYYRSKIKDVWDAWKKLSKIIKWDFDQQRKAIKKTYKARLKAAQKEGQSAMLVVIKERNDALGTLAYEMFNHTVWRKKGFQQEVNNWNGTIKEEIEKAITARNTAVAALRQAAKEAPGGALEPDAKTSIIEKCSPCTPTCGEKDLAISYTSQQMQVNESQELSAYYAPPCTPALCCPSGGFAWKITAGGGSISQTTGPTTTYYAPGNNPNCVNNATIELIDCCNRVATLGIAIHNTEMAAYHAVLTRREACDENIPGGTVFPSCPSGIIGPEYPYNFGYCCVQRYSCDGAFVSAGWRGGMWSPDPAEGFCVGKSCGGEPLLQDIRTGDQKAQGCCPMQLL